MKTEKNGSKTIVEQLDILIEKAKAMSNADYLRLLENTRKIFIIGNVKKGEL